MSAQKLRYSTFYSKSFPMLAILLVLGFFSFSQNKTINPPNIIVFLVDDMGWQDTSVPFWTKTTDFNKRYHTPNMEQLAREGIKFTNAYAMPVCTPTRVSLITGVNAAHHWVTHWTSLLIMQFMFRLMPINGSLANI